MIEQELKGLITLDIYNELSNRIIWDKKYVQINFYYTNNHINNQNITIRVRCKNDAYYLQIKVKKHQQNGFRTSEEYKLDMTQIPQCISQDQLKQAWNLYNYGDVHLQGFLVTERFTKLFPQVELMLDRNSYNGIVDYEIEMECASSIHANQLVHEMKLTDKIVVSRGKYERFCQSINHA